MFRVVKLLFYVFSKYILIKIDYPALRSKEYHTMQEYITLY